MNDIEEKEKETFASQVHFCRMVSVSKDSEIILYWTKPLTGKLSVQMEGNRIVVRKTSLLGTDTYRTAASESVSTSNSWIYGW